MRRPVLDSMLLASTDPERLGAWYAQMLDPDADTKIDGYRMLRFGRFTLVIDRRDDLADVTAEPGRMILNFDVEDALATAARLDRAGVTWLAPLEDRDGSWFATALDPDGNYVQLIQVSPEHRREMEQIGGAAGPSRS